MQVLQTIYFDTQTGIVPRSHLYSAGRTGSLQRKVRCTNSPAKRTYEYYIIFEGKISSPSCPKLLIANFLRKR